MGFVFVVYFVYLFLYALVSYAILFHLMRFRVNGDRSQAVIILYITVSLVVIVGSILLLRPLGETA